MKTDKKTTNGFVIYRSDTEDFVHGRPCETCGTHVEEWCEVTDEFREYNSAFVCVPCAEDPAYQWEGAK